MFEKEEQVTELTTDGEKGTLIVNWYTNEDNKCSPSTEECLLHYTTVGKEGQSRIIQADKCSFRNLAPTLRGDGESTIGDVEFLSPKFFLYNMEEGTIIPYSIN